MVAAACGSDPSGPDGRQSALEIDTFSVTARLTTPGVFSYGAFVTLRETAGTGAALSSVTVILADVSGSSSTAELPVATAFGTARIGARGTLVSTALAVSGVLATASSFTVRVGFRGNRGAPGASERTTPVGLDVSGAWRGPLPIRTPAGDWSLGRATLVQTGADVAGDLVSRDEARYPLTGRVLPDGVLLQLGGLPGTSTCSAVALAVTQFTFGEAGVQRMTGGALGRCFGTVAGAFELERG